jgi:hypothetical protein
MFLRLNPNIEPKQFHAATLTLREVEELRRIQDVVRKGYITKIEAHQIIFADDTVVEAKLDTLYVDCTASCIPDRPSVPVFQPGKIVLQFIRYPVIPYSCAKIAFLEALTMQDEERNNFATPIKFTKSLDDFIIISGIDMENRVRERQHPLLQRWVAQSRLDVTTRMTATIKPEDVENLALLERMQASFKAAYINIPKLIASIQSSAIN